MKKFYTAESVTEGHPDKLCDLIADNVLDACLAVDPAARVACEALATRGHIVVAGEISTTVQPDVFNITRDVVRGVGYDPKAFQIDCWLHAQSPDIAGAVHCKKSGGGRHRRALPGHAGLCHRHGRAGHGRGGHVRHLPSVRR